MTDPSYLKLSAIARQVVDQYNIPEVSAMYIDGTPLDGCGDTLFTFIVREIEEAGSRKEAISLLESARRQIDEAIETLNQD